MWLNTYCLVLLDMFSLMLEIGWDWTFLICANLKSSFSPLVSASSCSRGICRSPGGVMYSQRTCSRTAMLNRRCSLSGQRCQNYNSQAAPGQSSSWALAAAGRARDAARIRNTTAAPRQDALSRHRTKVRCPFAKDIECIANVPLVHWEDY